MKLSYERMLKIAKAVRPHIAKKLETAHGISNTDLRKACRKHVGCAIRSKKTLNKIQDYLEYYV